MTQAEQDYEFECKLFRLRSDARHLKLRSIGRPELRQAVIAWEHAEEELLQLQHDGIKPGYEWREVRIKELEQILEPLRKQIYA